MTGALTCDPKGYLIVGGKNQISCTLEKIYSACYGNTVGWGSSYSLPLVVYVNSWGTIYAFHTGSVSDGLIISNLVAGGVEDTYTGRTIAPDVERHSIAEIRAFAYAHPVSFLKPEYDVAPSNAYPYNLGQVKREVLQDGLNTINQIRYIAGLSYEVALNDDYSTLAQAASLVSAANGNLSHYPVQPEEMPDGLYKLGTDGASSSNLSAGRSSLAESIISGYLSDGDNTNIEKVGHRRWLLNPTMGSTGLGIVYAPSTYYRTFSAMYAFDRSGRPTGNVSMWPAYNTPVQYFGSDYPWSYSTGSTEDIAKIRVELKNVNTGEEWRFSRYSYDGYFNVDNNNYGLTGCIIFRPTGMSYNVGDVYNVRISGLSGDMTVEYTVHFFDLYNEDPSDYSGQENGFNIDPSNLHCQWYITGGKSYWYENSIRQGTYDDPQGVIGDGTVRGREIYDPASDGWYWLDACYDGAKAIGKEVWIPYIYQAESYWSYEKIYDISYESDLGMGECVMDAILNHTGKWVRYDENGAMLKGWVTIEGELAVLYPEQKGNEYYYDHRTGLMAKGHVTIDGVEHYFDEITGVKQW